MTPPRGREALPPVEADTGGTGRLGVRPARERGCVPVRVTARPGACAFLSGGGAPEGGRVPRSDDHAPH
ncbi:MAG: hypothetical protein ACJ8J0_06365, partial [Longimicrobiaceae bacterium]